MIEETYLVIYYDGNANRAAFLKSAHADSSAPHVWGLPDNYLIIAVVDVNQKHVNDLWIDEEQVLTDENRYPPEV